MVDIIPNGGKEGAERLRQCLSKRSGSHEESVEAPVRNILTQVREEGDKALIDFTARFDGFTLDSESLRITPEEIEAAWNECDTSLIEALQCAAERIRAYHLRQLPENCRWQDESGVNLGWRWQALASVGLYVPGGKASYPSSVLMNAVPARAAGVGRIAMVVPAPGGVLNPALLAAARVAGITEIYRIGGAQAVAALAYGTESIPAVDKIVGPGNAYVTEAKRQVFGAVGIDGIAGPSEICIIADPDAPPDWIAADLLSQAEHDEWAQSILITTDAAYAKTIVREVEQLIPTLKRSAIARASWETYGIVMVVKDRQEAAEMANIIAAEHLELAVSEPEKLLPHIRHAGAIFLGCHTPEAVGDYIAGPSHVLPTMRTARFASGLSVFDFLTRTSLMGCTPAALAELGDTAARIADAEGLEAHALSLRVRAAS